MSDKRIELNGSRLDFTCENWKFKTNLDKGFDHYGTGNKGSVTEKPLYDGDCSLFIEHVVNKQDGKLCYWFMWYDENGLPLIPGSGVIDEVDILSVVKNITAIKF